MDDAGLGGTGGELAFLPEESNPGLSEEVSLELIIGSVSMFTLTLKSFKSSLLFGTTFSPDFKGKCEEESGMVPSDEIDDTEVESCLGGSVRFFRSSTTYIKKD